MRRVTARALHVLLTDPVTGEPLDMVDILSLACGLAVALLMMLAMIVLALGLGSGQ